MFSFYLAPYHFDDETFSEGRNIITNGLSAVKASNKRENFETAREQLGKILHPLQVLFTVCFVSITVSDKCYTSKLTLMFSKQHNNVIP